MFTIVAAALAESGQVSTAGFELGRGAIAGGLIVAIAFLAGYAAIRRSGLAACGLLMVTGAAALQFSWLGFFPTLSAEMVVLIQALFAAAAIVFLSASISAARYNALLGGAMFTAALIIGGMGLINFFDRIDLAQLMRWSVFGIGGFAGILALSQAIRGDLGARLILPGVALALAAPFFGPLGVVEAASANFAGHGLFALGIVAASLVALTDGAVAQRPATSEFAAGAEVAHAFQDSDEPHHSYDHGDRERNEVVLESQIARVLDYSGVAIWDWGTESINQTPSLASLLGSQSTEYFTPDAIRNFLHEDDKARFNAEIMAPIDGPFDATLKLFDGRSLRMRGARAADEEAGSVERLVAFFEIAQKASAPAAGANDTAVRKATEAAIVPAAADPSVAKLSKAIDDGDIVAAFQPVVSLDSQKIAGYEALARWRGQEDGADEGPETFVKAADAAGKGAALSLTMLDQAASFLAEKLSAEKRDDLFVTMNVSWNQISESSFANAVSETIKKHKLPNNALVLELTEGDAVSDAALAGKVFKSLKSAGAALAFDDFGSGFTCLSNLCQYDFDYLKIDKSFAASLETGGDGAKVVEALADLGKNLGLEVIVEGIETKAAAKKALEIGCAYGQGFALGKPSDTEATDKKTVLNKLASYAGGARKDKDDEEDFSQDLSDSETNDNFDAEEGEEKRKGRWKFWGGTPAE